MATVRTDDWRACRPNFSAAGRRSRRWIAVGASAGTAGLLALLLVVGAPWYLRLVLFGPAAISAGAILQVRRNTCVTRAWQGTVEHQDYSTTTADPVDAAASRRVAAGIRRDAVVIGALCAVMSALTVLVWPG